MSDPLKNSGPLIRRVYAYVAYRIGPGHDAEDITSEVFERALRYRTSFDEQRGDATGWLIGIARRCIADRAPHNDPPSAPIAVVVEGHEDAIVRAADLADAVSRLPDRDRELIALRFGADMSAREIGQALELRTNTVEVALHRALARLRGELDAPLPRSVDPITSPTPDATYS